MITAFKAFMADPRAWDMYVTGRAGTGKTTDLKTQVEYCIAEEIPYVVLAFTHKACGVLRTKLPEGAVIETLHKFLKKRPGINSEATRKKHVDITVQQGAVIPPRVAFVDEYSMVGERDLMSIRELQDEDYDGTPELKVVWLGDPYQLPPVGDAESVRPTGVHQHVLTKIWRRDADNPLGKPIDQLVSFIEGADPAPLITSKNFVRGADIVEEYLVCDTDKVLLAYTNRRVQALNALCQGRTAPEPGDRLFSPTTKHHYTYIRELGKEEIYQVDKPFGEPLPLNTKYKTLEHLLKMDVKFCECEDDDGELMIFAYEFGHQDFKDVAEELKTEAVESNFAIEKKHKKKPAFWAKANPQDKMARRRAKAWRDFLTHNECVVCLDFSHAMTVHKSQGSTFGTVFLDSDDLAIARSKDYIMYLRLFYVALSRASLRAITN
jgi:ATP-dependent exoDNAse (exonuclease V) alpha subunit